MKQVFDKQTVAHLWANKAQDSARVSGDNFYFSRDTIYSYGSHFPIAKHFKDVVLFTNRTYSNTTAKHISIVRGAASHLKKVYCYYLPYGETDTHEHNRNIETWIKHVESLSKSLLTARKPENYVHQIEQTVAEMNEYLKLFNLKLTKQQKAIISVRDKAGYYELNKKAIEANKRFEASIKTKGKALFEQSLNAWYNWNELEFTKGLSDKANRLLKAYEKLIDNNVTRLRILEESIYTSKGVEITLPVAKRVYDWYLTKVTDPCTDCNKEILGYKVTQANKDALIVGCHNISFDEINRVAKILKW